MAESVTPFLMFEGRAQEAIDLYLATFRDAELLEVVRYGPDGPGPDGTIVVARLSIADRTVMFSDSFVEHAFGFTPAASLYVDCSDGDELERLFDGLSTGGSVHMPLDDYGFSQRFGWVDDRFGVSWQLNLP